MTNLLKNVEIDVEKFKNQILTGDLYGFEESFFAFVMREVYDKCVAMLIETVVESKEFQVKMNSLAKQQRMGKLQKRSVNLQIRTGTTIKVELQYARLVPKTVNTSRYLGFQYWGIIAHASPSYYSQVSKFSVLCGSFEIAKDVFSGLQIGGNLERIRSLSLAVSKKCLLKRVESMLGKDDNLAGKRVVISTDGGRIRTRQYKQEMNDKETHHKFETPWKEPKLFVISIIDKDGKIEKKELPIYDATFTDDSLFILLGNYLKSLNISQVSEVQVIADGALWIWNNAKNMLMSLGVSEEKIIETLDYFHAVEHLKKLTELLPKEKNDIKNKVFDELKALLWEGNIKAIIEKIGTHLKRTSKKIKTELAYFEKNTLRMNYQVLRKNKWLCGSGIIESGVRRMINLRFKSPSCFWKQENLDGLIFLRCALLSGRWKFIMQTITNF